ncbi:unnamed protein product [Linum tenue]|uniref:Delta(3)-Delta(2)-enoyl-CoA isomerase n=1 Tax=Linum tenue TaxID=586396 RepID=A0AAV0HEY2_9ROSI|nr:unnamed protein product [Linum tenue]
MCTLEQRSNIFVLTLTGNDDEHRLSPTLIAAILSALRQIKSVATSGSVLITNSQGRFFSNGLDLPWALAAGCRLKALARLTQMVESLRHVVAELVSLPIPTIAVVQGHAAAAGFVLALSHDYMLMREDRGVLYMSEIDLGGCLPDYFTVLFRAKIGSGLARRDVVLGGRKVRGREAVEMGIVDGVWGCEQSLREASMELAERLGSRKWDGKAYEKMRKGLYPKLCIVVGAVEDRILPAKL